MLAHVIVGWMNTINSAAISLFSTIAVTLQAPHPLSCSPKQQMTNFFIFFFIKHKNMANEKKLEAATIIAVVIDQNECMPLSVAVRDKYLFPCPLRFFFELNQKKWMNSYYIGNHNFYKIMESWKKCTSAIEFTRNEISYKFSKIHSFGPIWNLKKYLSKNSKSNSKLKNPLKNNTFSFGHSAYGNVRKK